MDNDQTASVCRMAIKHLQTIVRRAERGDSPDTWQDEWQSACVLIHTDAPVWADEYAVRVSLLPFIRSPGDVTRVREALAGALEDWNSLAESTEGANG